MTRIVTDQGIVVVISISAPLPRSWRAIGGDFGRSEPSFLECPGIFDTVQMHALCIESDGASQARKLGCKGVHFKLDAL
jgi:hypothetical protein